MLWVPLRALLVVRKYRLPRSDRMRLTRIAWSRFADPNDLVLFDIQDADALDVYLRRFELAGVMREVNPAGWRPDCVLNDKLRFYAQCAAHALPHPHLYAHTSAEAIAVIDLPRAGMIVAKPIADRGGQGFRHLLPQPEDTADATTFARFLTAQLDHDPRAFVVQERIIVHSDLSDLALDALPTVRVTTMLNEAGYAEIVTSVLRLPSKRGVLVDNSKAGGLLASVDTAGRLGAAKGGKFLGEFPSHPVTGAPIGGRLIPNWDETKSLVTQAHLRAFNEYTLVGWDVGISDRGPVLIEGNSKPCAVVAQRANGSGIGATRFGDLIRLHLSQT